MHKHIHQSLSNEIADAKERLKKRIKNAQSDYRAHKFAVKDRRRNEEKTTEGSVDITIEKDGIYFRYDLLFHNHRRNRKYSRREAIYRNSPRPTTISLEEDRPYIRQDFLPYKLTPWIIDHCLHFEETVLAPLRRIRRSIILAEKQLKDLKIYHTALSSISLKLGVLNITNKIPSLACDVSTIDDQNKYVVKMPRESATPPIHPKNGWDYLRISSMAMTTLASYRQALATLPSLYYDYSCTVLKLLDPIRAHGLFGPKLGLICQKDHNSNERLHFFNSDKDLMFMPDNPPIQKTQLRFSSYKYSPPKNTSDGTKFEYWWRAQAVHIQRDAKVFPIQAWELLHFTYVETQLVSPVRKACAIAEDFIGLIPEITKLYTLDYQPLPIHQLALDNRKQYRKGEASQWY